MESGSLKFTGLEILRDYLYFLGGEDRLFIILILIVFALEK